MKRMLATVAICAMFAGCVSYPTISAVTDANSSDIAASQSVQAAEIIRIKYVRPTIEEERKKKWAEVTAAIEADCLQVATGELSVDEQIAGSKALIDEFESYMATYTYEKEAEINTIKTSAHQSRKSAELRRTEVKKFTGQDVPAANLEGSK